MKVHLTRSLHIDKHYYPAGEQEIPAETLKSKMFAKHIKAGHILEPAFAPRKAVHITPKQRAEVLLEKVFGKDKEDLTPEQAETASGGVKSDDAVEASSDEAAPQAKSGKKNR